jgi:uncharacterized protein (UPF0335 family)
MGKKDRGVNLPPGVLDELITRIEQLEENQAALEGAIQAFITVFAVRRLPDKTGDGGRREP